MGREYLFPHGRFGAEECTWPHYADDREWFLVCLESCSDFLPRTAVPSRDFACDSFA